MLILQISASIAAYAMRANIEEAIHDNMLEAMENYNEDYNAFAWNSTQYNVRIKPLKWSCIKTKFFSFNVVESMNIQSGTNIMKLKVST